MVLEYAQLLCTAHRCLDKPGTQYEAELYAPVNMNHPCALWVRKRSSNYYYLWRLFCAVAREYTYRFNRIHDSFYKFSRVLGTRPHRIERNNTLSPFAQAMPEDCRQSNALEAYRKYYRTHKRHLAKWTNRPKPEWWY
jgi:hypothetical protein